jgi:hypothetical protein
MTGRASTAGGSSRVAGGTAALSERSGAAPRSAGGGPKVGCQEGPTTDEWLRFFARHGVRNICGVLAASPTAPSTPSTSYRRCVIGASGTASAWT